MYATEINALILSAKDARHCLCAVNDETMRGSIDRTITNLEETIANLQKYFAPLPTPTLPDMGWVGMLTRPTGSKSVSSKDSFMELREREDARPDGWPFK